MFVIFFKRGIILPLLFLLPSLLFSNKLNSIQFNTWKNLLHIDSSGKPTINSPTFLLSYEDFSIEKELYKTIEFFHNDDNICKFPARYLWLKEATNLLNNKNFDLSNCNDLSNYIKKTNPQELYLVFVSENISNPSSMMGHVFFKMDGINENGHKVENAISFYTVIDTLNLPYLAIKSTIIGMKGYFVLKPYKKQIYSYVINENRNIWEYKLNLNHNQIKLISYHFWELKDIDITYYFTGFNCATIVDNILKIVHNNSTDKFNLWITPKDVIKTANEYKLISSSELYPSKLWNFKTMLKFVEKDKAELIINFIDKNEFFNLKNTINQTKDVQLYKLFSLAYLEYSFYKDRNKKIEDYNKIYQILNQKNNLEIDITKYKNPLKTQNDSRLSISSTNNKRYISLLPASHTIYDDNRQYSIESSLKIGEIELDITDKVKIEELNLFSMKSLIPWDKYSKLYSNELEINYVKQYDKKLYEHNTYNISYLQGITYQYSDDLYLYNLIGAGLSYGKNELYPYLKNEFGIIIYEILNMKTNLQHFTYFNNFNSNIINNQLDLTQSFRLTKDLKLEVIYSNNYNSQFTNDDFKFKFIYIF